MTVMLNNEEYEVLQEARFWQIALEQAGVDNWEGFGDAVDIFQKLTGEADTVVTNGEATENLAEVSLDEADLPEMVTLRTQNILALMDSLDMLSAATELMLSQAIRTN